MLKFTVEIPKTAFWPTKPAKDLLAAESPNEP
jgi:hypothetical protein